MSNREKLQLEITQKWDECCQSCCKYRRSNGDSDIRRFLTGSHCIKITTTHIQHTAKIEKAKSLERAVFSRLASYLHKNATAENAVTARAQRETDNLTNYSCALPAPIATVAVRHRRALGQAPGDMDDFRGQSLIGNSVGGGYYSVPRTVAGLINNADGFYESVQSVTPSSLGTRAGRD